jgi:hypothetical protein
VKTLDTKRFQAASRDTSRLNSSKDIQIRKKIVTKRYKSSGSACVPHASSDPVDGKQGSPQEFFATISRLDDTRDGAPIMP